jgi:hypothetical protein
MECSKKAADIGHLDAMFNFGIGFKEVAISVQLTQRHGM